MGYIQISLAPKKEHTKISINADYGYYSFLIYFLCGIFSIAIGLPQLADLNKTFGFSMVTEIAGAVISILGVFTFARFYLSHWMKKKRKIYEKLFDRFQKMLDSRDKNQIEPAISIPDNDVSKTEAKNTPSHRLKTK